MASDQTQGHATVTTFEGAAVTSERTYCCGTPPNASAYYPNVAWFCPDCGEVWRRQVYAFDFTYRPLVAEAWKVYTARCLACDAPRIRAEFTQLLKEYS